MIVKEGPSSIHRERFVIHFGWEDLDSDVVLDLKSRLLEYARVPSVNTMSRFVSLFIGIWE